MKSKTVRSGGAETQPKARRIVLRLVERKSYITAFPPYADPVLFLASGLFELEFVAGAVGETSCSVPVASLQATRIGVPGTAPAHLSFRRALTGVGHGRIDPETSVGKLTIDLEMSYPALEWMGAYEGPHGLPLAEPFIPVQLKLEIMRQVPGPNGHGIMLTPDFGPHYDSPVLLDFDLCCEVDNAARCRSLCLRIWVGNDSNRKPILNQERIDGIVAEANRIWGCNGGQCCISFSVSGKPCHPGVVGDEITLRKGEKLDEATLIGNFQRNHGHRDRRCHDVYFLRSITTGGGMIAEYHALGITMGGVPTGSVIQSLDPSTGAGYSTEALGSTLAHELGHAMGVATAPILDAEGVTGHSNKEDNLMREAADPDESADQIRAKTKLNKKQCDRARNHKRLRDEMEKPCTPKPREVAPL
jgi:hypothetical protein